MNILYINACVRTESRTDRLARKLLGKLGPYQEVNLNEEKLQPLTRDTLADRVELIEKQAYDDPWFRYARDFQNADVIVIGAPFWDLSFPACLKAYIENIYVMGLVSEYGADGSSTGLCKAKKVYYVTTAGGRFEPRYSYEYIRDLFRSHFGIPEAELIKAEMLDVEGYDVEEIMSRAICEIDALEV